MTGVSSMDNAGWEECLRIRREIVPTWMTLTMRRLEQFENSRDNMCLLLIQKRGGIFRFIIHNLLKFANALYFHINETRLYSHSLPGQTPAQENLK